MDGFKPTVKMKCGGSVSKAVEKCRGGKMKTGGKVHDDIKEDKKIVKKAIGMHDDQQHEKRTDLSGLKKGGRCKKKGGTVRKYANGGLIEAKGKGKPIDNPEPDDVEHSPSAAYKKGGKTKKFADGGLTGNVLQAALNADQLRKRRAAMAAAGQAGGLGCSPLGGPAAAAPAAPVCQSMPQDIGASAGPGVQPGATIPGQKRGGRAGKKK